MIKQCYINGMGSVSTQDTVTTLEFDRFKKITSSTTHAVKPNYKEFIPPAMIRRMANGVKMGVVASRLALQDAQIDKPNAIITGTGLGCVNDSEKFLKNMIDNDEEFLTPTSFIQSTHNTVGAQIALGMECKAYNVTYVHNANSFEAALIDAQLQVLEGIDNILVGGIDEIGSYTSKLYELAGHVKVEGVPNNLLSSSTPGACLGEGAHFFTLSDKKAKDCYATLCDVDVFESLEDSAVENKIVNFLERHNLSIQDIDLVMLGNNGDYRYDQYYHQLQQNIFNKTPQASYKNYSAEYHTASAFGLWLACHIFRNKAVNDVFLLNEIKPNKFSNILLYNQYRGKYHSLVLLKSC